MNALELFRTEKEMTFDELAKAAGYGNRSVAFKHCKAELVPELAAYRYSNALGIPLGDLRPDLVKKPIVVQAKAKAPADTGPDEAA